MIATVRGWVRFARRPVALTGAGISAESGIPTFRGAAGLWRRFRAEELATPQAFARDPQMVWEWYDWRRSLIAKAEPNPGHLALARLPKLTVITQNVDGLHRRAGSLDVIEVHGDIWIDRCTRCRAEHRNLAKHDCPACGSLTRPGVVWFGEGLDPAVWDNAEEAARAADIFLVIGTSAVVYPAASLAPLAKASGARVVEINLDETPLSAAVDATLRGPSGEILPQLIE
jgi:NAD-dependent deacetylase